MLVRKRSGGGGSILKRTSSTTSINKELSNTETNLEAPPSDNNSIDNTPHFLRTCRLCHRRLVAGQDIYMYRGDTAFCSLECREEQMKEDERKNNNQWKNNNKVSSMNKQQQDHPPPSSSAAAAAKTHSTQLAAA